MVDSETHVTMTDESMYLQIGEAAEQTGLTQRTLRYYEEKGLLEPPTRMEGGFRLYSPEDLERVERIKQLRDLLGFSLAEIREMMQYEDIRLQVKADWRKDADLAEKVARLREARHATSHQLELVHQKLQKMTDMREALIERLAKYDEWIARHEDAIAEAAAPTGT
jgi:DNA-binding transcriptional MerR regulator